MLICALLRIDLAFCFQIWHGLCNSATGRLPWKSFVCFYPAALDALQFWYPLALSISQNYCSSTPWSTITAICPSNQSIKNCPAFLGKQNKAKQNRWLAKCRLVFLHCHVSSRRIADSVTASSFSILIAMMFFSLFLPAELLALDQKSRVLGRCGLLSAGASLLCHRGKSEVQQLEREKGVLTCWCTIYMKICGK